MSERQAEYNTAPPITPQVLLEYLVKIQLKWANTNGVVLARSELEYLIDGLAYLIHAHHEPGPITKFKVGDKVKKERGDYLYSGTVKAAFLNDKGSTRYVVECDVPGVKGLLFIFNDNDLALNEG